MSTLSSLPRARVPVAGLVRSVGGRVPPPSVARLRAAVTALFVLDGAVFGSWAARVPDVAERVGAGHSTLGVALLCGGVGLFVAGALSSRFTPRPWWYAGLRQLLFGAAAAVVTYLIGAAIGVSVS